MKKRFLKYLFLSFAMCLATFLNLSAQTNRLGTEAEKHIEEGRYLQAEILLLQLDSIQRSVSDTLSADYSNTLSNLGYVQAKKGKYQESDNLYQKALNIRSDIYGKNSIEYALTLIDLSTLHIQMQHFEDVEEKLFTAKNIIENKLGGDSQYYADVLYQLSVLYCFSQQAEKAFDLLNKAEKIYLDCLGEHHRKYANLMTAFGTYYFFQNDYKLSDQYYSKAKLIFRSGKYKDHPDYLDCLFAKTSLDAALGKLESAKSALLEGLELVKKYFGEEHPHYAGALSNLGGIYYMGENYSKAEPILKESLRVSSIVFGKKHSFYFNALNMLAVVYMSTGAYELAEPLYLESLDLRKQLYGENNQSVFTAINNLADLYISIENYDKAENLIDSALNRFSSLHMDESTIYASLITQQAIIYEFKKEDMKALTLYEKAANIYKKELGEDHPAYILLLANVLDTKIENLQKDESLDIEHSWLDIINRWEKNGKENQFGYISAVNNLATYYMEIREYEKARLMLEENLGISKKNYGENNRLYQALLWNLAVNEEAAGNPTDAQIHFKNYFGLKRNQLQRFFTFMSEKEREIFIESFWDKLNIYHALCYKHRKGNSDFADFVLDYELFSKSLLLNSSLHLQQTINNSEDETLKEKWAELKSIKNDLIKLLEESLEEQTSKKGLEERANTLEKNILSISKEYNKTQKDFYLRWEDVQKELSDNEATIEFINFKVEYLIPQPHTDTIYSAIVLSEEKKPEMVYLCSIQELRTAIQKSPYNFSAVYPLVWKPLEKYLKGRKNIYIASSGLLNGVSFASVQKGGYDIHNVLSTKDISRVKKRDTDKVSASKAVLFGGADFSLANKDLLKSESGLNSELNNDNITSLTRSIINEFDPTRGQGFSYLLGSKREVLAIDSILRNRGWDVDLYVDKYATEARLKTYSPLSPDILHISTHGFYYPNAVKHKLRKSDNNNPYKMSDNPLIRSGLAFAGANKVWDKTKIIEDIDDGILTAYEISNLDLSNTKLVILSACKTGLGDIVSNEGIYGLQRAFRLAGVESIIVSLWDINDNSTSEFMKEFYSLWNDFDKYNIRQAFFKAQNIMKIRYSKKPEKWAGFILIE